MTTPTNDVTDWVKDRMNDLRGDGLGAFTSIEAHHALDEDNGSETLKRVGIRDGDDPLDVAQELWDAIEDDANSRVEGRMQRYVLLAFRDGQKDPEERKSLRMSGRATMNFLGGDTEAPTGSGHLAQLMRHNEQLTTRLMQLNDMTTGRLARDLEAERQRNLVLEKERSSMFEMYQELQDKAHERKMEIEKEEAKQRRYQEVMGLVMSVAPLAMSRMLSAPVGGNQLPAAGARDESTHQFLKSLSEEEAQKLLAVVQTFPMEKQMALMALYQEHARVEEERESPKDPSEAN